MPDGRGRWARNPGDLPPAIRDALHRCPTCGTPWPTDVDPDDRTTCDGTAAGTRPVGDRLRAGNQ